ARLMAYAVAENQIDKLGTPKLAILPSPQALNESTWRALLKYVSNGGNLLVSGSIERDEHWQRTARAAELKIPAQPEPLTHRQAEIKLGKQSLAISFEQQAQSWLEWLHFSDGSGLKETSYGRGRIFWAANPVELAEGLEPAAEIYRYVAGRVGVAP